MEDRIKDIKKFLTENRFLNTLAVFENEITTDEKPSFRELDKPDFSNPFPFDKEDKHSERQITDFQPPEKISEQGFQGSFRDSFGENNQNNINNSFGSFANGQNNGLEDNEEELPIFESKRVMNNEFVDNPLSEEGDKFSFNENNNDKFGSFGESNGVERENNSFSNNPFAESKIDFTSGFHSIAPKKTHFLVPNYTDECRLISYCKIYCC